MGDKSRKPKTGHFPPLTVIPDIHEFSLDAFCEDAARTIDCAKERRANVRRLFNEQNEEVKRVIYKNIPEPYLPKIIHPCDAHKDMRAFADQTPAFEIVPSVVQMIFDKIGKARNVSVYASIAPALYEEVRDDYYIRPLHELTVDTKVVPYVGEQETHIPLFGYKYLGHTENYDKFVRLTKYMNERLFITYPLVRKIKMHIVDGLPRLALHFHGLRKLEGMELHDLTKIIQRRIMRANLKIEGDWYMHIVKFIPEDQTSINVDYIHDYLNTAQGLVSLYVSMMVRRTIREFVVLITNIGTTPFLKLKLYHDFDLKLLPNPNTVELFYCDLVKDLSELISYMRTLEYFCTPTSRTNYIKLDIPNRFLLDQLDIVQVHITPMFDEVNDYIDWLETEFRPIYDEQTQAEHVNSLTLSFDEGCELIEYYRSYIDKLRDMVPNVYFKMCVVDTTKALEHIRKNGERVITALTSKLILIQKYENIDICEMFEFLRMRAETVPRTTHELMELGRYMVWASIEHLNMLTQRVQNSIGMMLRLIQNTKVSEEYIDLMATTINWCFDIKPILDKNASMLERVKFEFEENLQKKIEYLTNGIQEMFPNLQILNDMDDADRATEYLPHIRSMIKKIRKFDALVVWINREEVEFKFPVSAYNELEELKRIIFPFFRLIFICHKWRRYTGVWMDGPFEHLDYETVEQFVEDLYKELLKTLKNYRNILKQGVGENKSRHFTGLVDDPDPLNLPSPVKLCNKGLQNIKDFRPTMFVISVFSSSALCQRHWDEMSSLIGYDMTPDAGTTLRKLIIRGFGDFLELFEIISTGAVKERQLEIALAKMKAEWEEIRFKTNVYKDTKINILTALDDIQAVLDDHIIKTLTMRGSVFVKHIEVEVKEWYDKIVRINKTIEEWGKVQSQWLYLLPIFSSKDIIAQMPEEGVLFREVDNVYRRYMNAVQKDNRVIETAGALGMLEALVECTKMLDQVNEGVANYLEKKRLVFPRFFFLSNDEMLEILSETKNPMRVQPHLRKCFEGINKLEIDDALIIYGMFSQEGENINFTATINTEDARGSVEKWLVQVETQMLFSVKNEISCSFEDYKEVSRNEWVQRWAGQVILAISQVYWTTRVHECLCKSPINNLYDFHEELYIQLQDVVELVRSPELSNMVRITIKALIVIDVHAKDVVLELLKNRVTEESDFKWLAQLRYYWEEDCLVKMINATVPYAYEYLGNSDRLVITPLTDRCYRTLIGAYHLHLNGAPEGPAGTGKTETTKDLAKAIAVQCVVFNCSDGLDYKAMGKFFKGLASSGAWACFDEFNRIELEVLSVVAQQILSIVLAVRAHVEKFVFEGTELILNPTVYICITMNPGYAGRSELPDNLKVLFRTVAMMVPDYAMIGEISLYSYGFKDARTLSVKIVTTYRLCSEQLSSQNHYDYGMRAVKTVLSACGNIKRKFPDENEDILLLRSLVDVNLPKFLSHDVPLFEGIISDLFPGIALPTPDYRNLLEACQRACENRILQPRDTFLLKVIQTYEMMIVRHGFMLVGDPFSGKTSTLKVLGDTLTTMSELEQNEVPVHYQFINPKSITMGQLYGQFDPISYEWTDGVVATCFRKFCMDERPDRNWVIFDGPVDAVWIENMNTVLDDNKKLCLTSGEVMAMTNSMSMIFEVMDLTQASPATVSRCGMIYMESANLGWRPFLESWILTVNPILVQENDELYFYLFDWLINPCLNFVRKQCKQLAYPGEINLVLTTLKIIEMSLNHAIAKCEDDSMHLNAWIQGTVMYAIVWGIGGILDANSRQKFDEFYKDLWKGIIPDCPIPEYMDKLEVSLPTDGLVMDYIFVYKTPKGSWKYWPDLVKIQKIDEDANAQQVLIPTVDTAKYMHLVKLHIEFNLPLLLVGPTGTGKSFYLQNYLMNRLNKDKYEPAFLTFTAQTLANQTQDLIISKLVKGKKGHYYAPKNMTSVIFIDDLNMPTKEVYGAQPPIELLRQFFDHGHWYNLKDTSKLYIHNMLIMSAMGLVGGSRQDVYPRFLRHFSMYSINEFSDESMVKIFSNVLLIAYKRNGFATDVYMNVLCIVNATLEMYKSAIKDLRPTPMKSHYIFNLRDISRIIQGCGLLKKESAENKKVFAKLWVHENLRIFYDRLIDSADRNWFYLKLRDCIRDFFKEHFDSVFDNLKDSEGVVTEKALNDLFFGTYLDLDATEEDKRYEEIESIDVFKEIATNCLDEYNSTHKSKMDIVLFRYALEHLSKLCRILQMPRGSALLVGIGGSGRQSLTRLATAICGHVFFQPEITKNYGLNEFRDDIKLMLREAGGLGKHTIFLFTEDQLKEESFLQDIDSLLNSGEVPNLYPIDERQEILELVRLAAQGGNRNLDISPLAVFSFFINRCKDKLHIILSFSPIGASFRSRLRLYPSLVNCCTIDWYESWTEDALEMVAKHWMKSLDVSSSIKDASVESCKFFHVEARELSDSFFQQYGRKTYITSASYLDLIISFQSLMKKKQEEITVAKFRYLNGLDKLDFAAAQVSEMQKSLEELQPQLKEMTAKALAMLIEIERETEEAEHASMLVREDEKVANVQAAAAQALKAECEADLAQAIPILEEAIAALNTLKPTDITLVKSMKNPPAAIKLVMAAVCVIKDIKPDRLPEPGTGRMVLDFWGPSKRLLGEMNFLQQLKDFDKDHIPIAIMTKIRKDYLPLKDFKPEIVAKASSAAEGLCKWIIAMDLYDAVAREVAPKKEKLERAESEYATTMAILKEKRDQVARLEERLENLNKQLQDAQAEQQRLQDAVDLCSEKLNRAKKLIGGLGGEKHRWQGAAADLQVQFDCLAGDILISCGVIAYLAPLTIQIRNDCVTQWRDHCIKNKIPCSSDYDFIRVLGSDITIQEWYIHGLPRDAFSTQNAIIQSTSIRWSLLIDPQNQANKWIKLQEKANNCGVVKFTDANYMKVIEHCIEFGMPVLVENIQEHLEAPLDPLLSKKTFKQGGVLVISLGDNVIPYHPHFRLYLTTKLRNPHYMPEVFNKVTVINFALTMEGLEDQLLGIVVANERPDLQKKKEQLVIDSAENRSALKEVEDSILRTLSETEGNILENETAIQVLDHAKDIAQTILQKQKITKSTETTIESFRQVYRPVATHSTILYYSISDLPNVDPMYQYSLAWFINLYRISVLNSSKTSILEQRLDCIKEVFTFNLYSNVCRSLFEKDKLLFSFVLCLKIMESQNNLNKQEYMFFLTGGIPVENQLSNPGPGWLSNKSWDEVCRLNDLSSFKGFVQSFSDNIHDWQIFYDLPQPQDSNLPGGWQKKLSPFARLMIIRILRPDKLNVSIHQFVNKILGNDYVSPPPFDLAKSYADSNNLCPLVFILSPGADPIMALNKFAERKGYSAKFQSISLGQGQGPIAEALITDGMITGSWVCLQNCHLAVSWMSRLEKLCELMDDSNTHDTFRLWLTSYPSDKFPVSILQNGVKMTNEPPTGLHQNLRLSYLSDPIKDPDFYYSMGSKEFSFTRLLYAICFFHAVVQERRTFGPLGWNIPYGFNDSDLHISIQQLQMFIQEYEDIPYEAITYLTGECNYGGRVTDDWDRRLIITILNDFLNPGVVNDRVYLFSTADKCYGLPMKTSYDDFLEHIDSLPEQHPPEVFGLHKNAGITRDLQNTALMLSSLLLVEGESTSGGADTDEILNILTREILLKLPDDFNMELAKEKYPVDYSESMNTVLVQELERFNKLLSEMRRSIVVLQHAISGLVVMTPDLEMLSSSLLLSRIPVSWAKVSYPSLKPLGSYITDFIDRIEFLRSWHDIGKPITFWLSGFFFTQAFLTGAKQNHARKFTIPIDQLDFDHHVLKEFSKNNLPETGVYVNGLFVDGAHWDVKNGHLMEQRPKILWDTLPCIWLEPILVVDFDEGMRYKSPVYKTSERRGVLSTTGHSTNYVLPVFLDTKVPASHWVKRSAALLCQLDN